MKRALRYYKLMFLRHDLPAGISVFLVALPLCLGIALASNAPLYAGILSGVVGGIVVGFISGSHTSVSGPAAGLTTLVSATILSLGDYQLFLLSIIIAGFFQVLLGLLKFGIIASYFPSSVIKGMLASIGLLLIIKQIPIIIGYSHPDFWTSVFSDFVSPNLFLKNIEEAINKISIASIAITLVSIVVYQFIVTKYLSHYKYIPSPLIIVLIGVLSHLLLKYFLPSIALSENQLVSIPKKLFTQLVLPNFSALFEHQLIWKNGFLIGALATLETLLCVEAVDKLDRRNRITPPNRELVAQGIGNMICGFIGAVPLTAVVVRGSANINAGAKTKSSAIIHGFLLLSTVLIIPNLLNAIPYASLSVILLLTGFKLTHPSVYQYMWKLGSKQFIPFIITIAIILLTDLLVGVAIGLLLSIYFIIRNNFKVEYKVSKRLEQGIELYSIKLNSNVTFLNKVNLKKVLDEIPPYSVLKIDASESNFIDFDIIEIISEFAIKAKEKHIELQLVGIQTVQTISSAH